MATKKRCKKLRFRSSKTADTILKGKPHGLQTN